MKKPETGVTDPRMKDVHKLPKWAQELIDSLCRQRTVALNNLYESQDKGTKSSFFYEDLLCVNPGGPECVRHYVQSDRMSFEAGGLRVDMLYRDSGGRAGAPVLDIQYYSSDRRSGDILIQPRSFQQLYIYLPEKS